MKVQTHRTLRTTAAVAIAGSLLGVQALASSATASVTTRITWTPANPPGLWSDTDCTSGVAAPSNTPASPPSDARALSGSQTYGADSGPNSTGPNDVAWAYQPARGDQGGPVVTIPTSTTGMSIDVRGATTGRLMVTFTDEKSNKYVGVEHMTTSGDNWQTLTAGALTWYVWTTPLLGSSPSWQPANAKIVGLQTQNVPLTLDSFFKGRTGTAQAAFELGCGGAFAFDHLQVTDSSNVTDYDVQTPTSATTISQGATLVAYGAPTTIRTSTTSSDAGVVTTNPTGTESLQTSTDGGATWTTQAADVSGSTFTVRPSQATSYRVLYSTPTLNPLPSTSNAVSVVVRPGVVLTTAASEVNVGRGDTFTARVNPALTDVRVTFQQLSRGSWAAIGSATTNSSGVATLVKANSRAGAWKVRTTIGAQPGYVAAESNPVSVKVYQPASISAYRSASSVYVGRHFRIHGVVGPHSSGIALQLQQYVGRRWIVVASGRSGARGVYSFRGLARSAGVATFRVVAPASGYRRYGRSPSVKVTIRRLPVYTPPPPPPSGGGHRGGGHGGGGHGGGGSGIG